MIKADDAPEHRHFALVPFFMEFHGELLRLKRIAAAGGGTRFATLSPDADPEYIVRRLQSLLEGQALMAGRGVSEAALEQMRQAQYVMAALADDVFLYGLEWPGREAWRENILEYRLFKSRNAGEQVFYDIDELLRLRDPRRAELVPLYILALSLGFRGRFRGAPDRGVAAIKDLSRRLFVLAFDRPADPGAKDQVLTSSAYGHVLAGTRPRRTMLRATWPLVMAGVCIAFLLVSQATWAMMTASLETAADRVFTAAMLDPGPPRGPGLGR